MNKFKYFLSISIVVLISIYVYSYQNFKKENTKIIDQKTNLGGFETNEALSVREGNIKLKSFKIGIPNSPEYKLFRAKIDEYYYNLYQKGWSGEVLIAYKGKVLYKNKMGYKDFSTKEPIENNTSFQLASTSKPFTAVSILQLKDKGKLNLDDYVTKYIPEFPYSSITIRMLLSHRSGMQDYINFANAYFNSKEKPYMNNEDLIHMLADKKPALVFAPNTKFKYTNTNYAVLASIVERVSKLPFKTYVKYNIFVPLNMSNTSIVDPNEGMPSNASKCYKGGWNEYKFNYQDGVFGDKGVYSNVDDMLKFDQALYTNKLCAAKSIYEAFSPQSFDSKNATRNYGLGWRMYLYPSGEKIVYHNGLWHGNNSCFYRFIQDNFTIIIECNKFTKQTYYQPSDICDILASVEGINNKINNSNIDSPEE